MRKIILFTVLVFLAGCSDISRVFTPEVDRELNFQNVKAFEKIETESIVLDIKKVAETGKKNAIQLGVGSVGLPIDKSAEFSFEKSDELRKKSQEEADKSIGAGWLKTAETAFPWTALIITGIGLYTGWRKRKQLEELAELECKRKEVVYAGVEKVKKALPNQVDIITDNLKDMTGKLNMFMDMKNDFNNWKEKK